MSSPETIDEIPFGDPPPPRLQTATPRKCRHAMVDRRMLPTEPPKWGCRCGHVFDPVVVKRNRNNRKRGNSIERLICADLGVTPRGRYGDPVDGGSDVDPLLVQVKSGAYFKPQQQAILDAMNPQRHGRPAILVAVETPGPGHRARRLVTMTYDDWKAIWEWMLQAASPEPGNGRPPLRSWPTEQPNEPPG